MQIYIQDRSESTVATIGDFYEDMHKTLTSTGTGSYEFTVSKSEPGQEFLNVGNYVVLLDEQNKSHQFTITKVDQLHDEKTVYAEDASLQLLSKEARPWAKVAKAQPASYYFNKALEGTGWVIGVNQIANLTRTLEWTGWDTVLTRLLSIATEFDNAELDFHVELDRTNVVRKVVDIYKQVGAYRGDIQLVYGDTVSDIQKTESTENFATAIEGIGSLVENTKEGEPEKHYDFSAIGYDDGDFFSPKGDPKLYSRKAHEKWDGKYGYSERHFEYETKDPQELLNRSKTELKKRCEPEVNYEISIADGRLIDINKGDTVKIFDHTYNPELLLQARAIEVDKSYTDPSQNKAIFGNFLTLISNADPRILAIQKMLNSVQQSQVNVRANLGAVRKTATDAKNTATEAQSTAKQAVTKTSELDIALSQAKKDVDAVRTAVGAQDEEIANAVADANGAVAKADKAVEDAGFAKDTANQATKNATEAKTQASEAKATATESISQAGDALTKAGSAIDNASDALEKFENLSVGGRNYFLNSDFSQAETNWKDNSGVWFISDEKCNGQKVMTATPTVAWTNGATNSFNQTMSAITNQQVTVSVWAKASKSGANFHSEPTGGNGAFNTSLTNTWKRYSYVAQTNSIGTIYFMAVDVGTQYWISMPKVEIGNKVTDWSPAPEDVQQQFTNIDGELASKVSQTTYNTLAGTVDTVSTLAKQNQSTISTLATKTSVDTVNKTATTAQTIAQQNSNALKLKADSSTVSSLDGRVTSLSGQLDVQSGLISAKVTANDVTGMLNGYATQSWSQGQISTAKNEITASVETVNQKVNAMTGDPDNLIIGGDFEDQREYIGKQSPYWRGLNMIADNGDKIIGNNLSATVLQINGLASGNNDVISKNLVAVRQAEYNISLKTRWLSKDQLGRIIIYVFEYDSNKNPISHPSIQTDETPSGWKSVGATYKPSSSAVKYMALDVTYNGAKSTSPVWVDDIQMRLALATTEWTKAQLSITDSKINSSVTTINGNLSTLRSDLTQTSDSLKSTISKVDDNYTNYSSLEQKLNGFQTTVAGKADKSQLTQLSGQLTSTVAGKADKSQITQLADNMNLRVQKGDVINQINISPESILIAGKKVHITGETNIDNAVIKSAMIESISADKIAAGTITGLTINGSTINAGKIYGDTSLDIKGPKYGIAITSEYGISITGNGGGGTRLTDNLVQTDNVMLGGKAIIKYVAGKGVYAYYDGADHFLG